MDINEIINTSNSSEFKPQIYLINYKTKDTVTDYCSANELASYLDRGYIVVSKRDLYNYETKLIAKAQARLRKTELQRLRRKQGYTR